LGPKYFNNYFYTYFQVAATDADQGHYGSLTYSIVDGSYGMFVIDNMTGWINTTSALDRESKDSYILVVRASDGKDYLYWTSREQLKLSSINKVSLV
jgi:protocadherin Fat 1/2/3